MNSEIKRKEVSTLIDDIKNHSDRLNDFDALTLLELSAILSKIDRLQKEATILKFIVENEVSSNVPEPDKQGASSVQNKEDQTNDEDSSLILSLNKEVDRLSDGGLEEGEEIIVEVEVDESDISSLEEEFAEESNSVELEDGEEIFVEMEVEALEDDFDDLESTEEAPREAQAADSSESIGVEDIIQTLENEELNNLPDLNEQYAEEDDNSLSEQLQKQAITDLVAAVGLNERYLYANELFDGDLEEFKNSLNHINELETMEIAKRFFWDTLGVKYNWEKENELVKALQNLIERRFI